MWIVFIEISPTFERAFHAAHELGLNILWVGEGNTIPDSITNLADKSIMLNNLNFQIISSAVVKLVSKNDIKAFWTLKDKHVPLASRLTHELGNDYRYPSKQLVHNTKNKVALRELFKNTEYNPKYAVINSSKNLQHPFPLQTVVIKPPLGYASIGVEKVLPSNDFKAAVSRSTSVLNNIATSVKDHDVKSFNPLNTLLIEQFIEGSEYSVEVFANETGLHCLGICGKSEMKAPFFEEISYCLPADINEDLYFKISEAALKIAKIINLNSGMAHIELKVNTNEIKVLDIGLRLGGSGLTHELIYLSSGIDLVKAVLAEISNLPTEKYLNNTHTSIALLYLIQVEKGGTLSKIPNPDLNTLNSKIPEYIRKEIFANAKSTLTGYPNYSGLPGFVLYQINNRSKYSYERCSDIITISKDIFRLEYL